MTNRVLLPVVDFDGGLEHLRSLGLRIDRISPADDPREADLSRADLAVRLERSERGASVAGVDVTALERSAAGDGPFDVIDAGVSVGVDVPVSVPSLTISRLADSVGFGTGRAGMGYRDLIPDRWGGRFIASHIRIADGGPVPDYVHYHRIRFQMIYVHSGWVQVVYEDQGEPFVMEAGDCVLQPPEIRHRVLESSAGLEVVEIGCPAEHDTFAEHEIDLPTPIIDAARDFGGQRFVLHVAAAAAWMPWRHRGFECRDSGITAATGGLAGARTVRAVEPVSTPSHAHDGEFAFVFVRGGSLDLDGPELSATLLPGDSVAIPSGVELAMTAAVGTRFLEVTLPGVLPAA